MSVISRRDDDRDVTQAGGIRDGNGDHRSSLRGALDHLRHALEIGVADVAAGALEECRDRIGGGAGEERLDQMIDGGEAGAVTRDAGAIDVAAAVVVVPEQALRARRMLSVARTAE